MICGWGVGLYVLLTSPVACSKWQIVLLIFQENES